MFRSLQKIRYICLVVLQAVALFSLEASAQTACESQLTGRDQTKKVLRVFRDAYQADDCYISGECHRNVLRLYRGILSRVPGLALQDFHILVIGPKAGIDFSEENEDTGFHVMQGREGYSDGELTEFIFWKFHVVLEYRGFILDMDNRNQPTAYPRTRYFNEFFVSAEAVANYPGLRGLSEHLGVWTIPGEFYLAHLEIGILGVDQLLMHFVQTISPANLTDFQRDPD